MLSQARTQGGQQLDPKYGGTTSYTSATAQPSYGQKGQYGYIPGNNAHSPTFLGQDPTADQYASGFFDQSHSALGNAAPTADLTNANQDRGMYGQSYGSQQNALALTQRAALGQGPSAAQSQFGQNLNQALLAQQASANSARGGGAGLAAAQQQGAMQQAQIAGQGAQQAAALRAQEMQQAQQNYQGLALGMGAQNLQAQGIDTNSAFNQASLQEQQNALNQNSALAWAGMGQDALTAQLNADSNRYANNTGQAGASAAAAASTRNAAIGAGLGLSSGLLSAAASAAPVAAAAA